MTKYIFDMSEYNYGTVTVEANSPEEARIKADEALERGEYTIDDGQSSVELGDLAFTD